MIKKALVIGNNNYETSSLTTPINDAKDIADFLKSVGFDVTEKHDLNFKEFSSAITLFSNQIDHAAIRLFYFSGHGVNYNGKNFLLPIDADLSNLNNYTSFNLQHLLDDLQINDTSTNIILLDCCNANPFKFSYKNTGSTGFDNMKTPNGSIIGYAAKAGSFAISYHNMRNSIYTTKLLEHIKTPNLGIENLLKRTGRAVRKHTNKKQSPVFLTQFDGEFSFVEDSTISASDFENKKTYTSTQHTMSINRSITASPNVPKWALEKINEAKINKNPFLNLKGFRKRPKLKNIPEIVFEMPYLTKLCVSHNDLTSVSSKITQLKYLRELDLFANDITDLPNDLEYLERLKILNISNNQLNSLPSFILSLSKLEELHLNGNPFKNIAQSERSYYLIDPINLKQLQDIEFKKEDQQIRKKFYNRIKSEITIGHPIIKILHNIQEHLEIYPINNRLSNEIVLLIRQYNLINRQINEYKIDEQEANSQKERITTKTLILLEAFNNNV